MNGFTLCKTPICIMPCPPSDLFRASLYLTPILILRGVHVDERRFFFGGL